MFRSSSSVLLAIPNATRMAYNQHQPSPVTSCTGRSTVVSLLYKMAHSSTFVCEKLGGSQPALVACAWSWPGAVHRAAVQKSCRRRSHEVECKVVGQRVDKPRPEVFVHSRSAQALANRQVVGLRAEELDRCRGVLADKMELVSGADGYAILKDTRFQGGARFGWHGQSWYEEGT